MLEISFFLVFGFVVDCKKVFILVYIFLMGFKLWEEVGVFIIELMIFVCFIYVLVEWLVCLELLFWKNKLINDNLCFNYFIILKYIKKIVFFYIIDNRKFIMILVIIK